MTTHQPGIDGPVAARSASTAFTILLLGGLAAPLVAELVPVVGRFWLVVVAIVAFVVAGIRIGTAATPALHGAVCAVSGYLLMLPLVAMTAGLHVGQIATTATVAVVVGAVSGLIASRVKRRTP